ncbi:DNA polymerase III subunit delta [Candidatus Saccharibacteria bacterium RIFCSPHIGHO2_12_FULL_49_19]|nr:MAG: DNA polymerase III subunit delta [Candidatus Saccharibacteria bacterium RIFCSPHIGHO2_01_FULL_49_21]OGL36491.1 MAG: DNA polymerase III subunit delta [Candidatus Saccharibacteria bacterium RIFCSPHIGHO2_12_FULL_49_19]
MIITITGTNSYLVRRRLGELVSKFVAEYGELALERIDAEEADLSTVRDAVSSLPFLSNRKMVVVRNLSALKPSPEQIEQIISSITNSTDVVFYEPITDKRTTFYKILKSKTKLEYYQDLDSRELAKWLASEAKNLDAKLSLADANFLVDRVGTNQAILANELEKLLTYKSDVHREDIELLTEPTPQSKVFDLLDAAFSGDKKRALKLYEEQRIQKVQPQAILAMMAWQLRLIALAKHAGQRRADEVASDIGANVFPVSKAFGLAEKIEDKKLKILTSEALDIDVRGKTTSLDMDEALKTYIVTI